MAVSGPGGLMLQVEDATAPFTSARLIYPKFPLEEPLRTELATILCSWMEAVAARRQLHWATFLQGAALHSATLVDQLTERAAEWVPDLGLGVRPGDPPRLLTQRDLDSMSWNEFPRPRHETLFSLVAENAFQTAGPVYCGTGAWMSCLLSTSAESFFARQRLSWLPKIKELAFRAHTFYAPLLRPADWQANTADAAMANPMTADILASLEGVGLYMRESREDEGLVLISTDAFDFRQLDAMLQEDDSRPALAR